MQRSMQQKIISVADVKVVWNQVYIQVLRTIKFFKILDYKNRDYSCHYSLKHLFDVL
jgi:hypothetical protein